MDKKLRLDLAPRVTEFHGRSLGEGPMHINVGHQAMADLYFPSGRLDSASLERAIEWTEDRIQAARLRLPAGAHLYTNDVDMHALATASGVTAGTARVLHVDAVEQTFSRLVLQATGHAPSPEALPTTPRFYATVVLVRELMHHLNFAQVHVMGEAKTAQMPRQTESSERPKV